MSEETTETTETSGGTEVRDPAGLLKAYEQAKSDLVSLRTEFKALQDAHNASATDEYKSAVVQAKAELELLKRGFKDPQRLLPYIGTEGLEVAEDGSVSGLDDRLNKLKEDLPEVFDPKVRAGGTADIFANNNESTESPFAAAIRGALRN